MFWWFKRGNEFVRYESRKISAELYELTVVMSDGSERVERFTDEAALTNRQAALTEELESDGWTGPHGWNV